MNGPRPSEGAQDERDDQRAATDAQLDLAAAGEWNRQLSEQQAEREAGGETQRVDLAELAVGVAERRGDLAHPVGRADDAHPVAESQDEVAIDEEVGIASSNPGRHRAETSLQVDVAQAHSGQLPLRHRDAAEVELLAIEREVAFAAVAGPLDEAIDGVRRADDGAEVAGDEHDVVGGEVDLAAVFDPREGESFALPRPQLAEARQIRAGDDHGGTGGVGLTRGTGISRGVGMATRMSHPAKRPTGGDDHRHDPERVHERVADDRIGDLARRDLGSELLEGGRQCRRVRLRSGEQPGTGTGIEIEECAHTADGQPDRCQQHGDRDAHAQAVLTEAAEERRARREPDGVDEQRQPEQRDDGRELGQVGIGRRHGEPGEQCGGRSQPDALDPHSGRAPPRGRPRRTARGADQR